MPVSLKYLKKFEIERAHVFFLIAQMAPFLAKALRKTHNLNIAFLANPISRSPISPLSSFRRNLSSLPLSSSPSSQALAQAQAQGKSLLFLLSLFLYCQYNHDFRQESTFIGFWALDLCNLFLGFYTDPERQGKRWSRWLLFLPGAVTFGLGTWQIFRRQQKVYRISLSSSVLTSY